ncbi:MAG TPA: hypothetical protein VEH58_06125, partial [Dehalococcoidales bacterium]|nr:hypothetical protein [Dehalococcoidales bacterium]
MDTKTLEMLEFHKVREIIASYTSFPASNDLAHKLMPSSNPEQVALWLKQSSEARILLATHPDFNIGVIADIREIAGLANRAKILDTKDLSLVVSALTSIRLLKNSLSRMSPDFPLLWNIAKNIADLHSLEKEINSCVSPEGELLDSASAELQAIRHQIQRRRHEIIARLESIIHSARGQKVIQEPIVTERDGRYVIPVKVESKHDFQGIVHDVSNTGATVFIEPFESIESGNELRQLETEERREIERILSRLSGEIGSHASEISSAIAFSAEIDLIVAKGKFARRTNSSEPEIAAFDKEIQPALKLVEARHPLLAAKAVPLNIEIGKDFNILVITGPNTGGKTVALKTIGLLSLMALAGLPIPARETSVIPVYDRVFVDIGDEQSIEQTLSTFSWHITNLTHIIRESTNRSFVAIDELGTSTDPAEGSALARAILLRLLNKKLIAVATTHLGDLKAFAYATKGMQNASLDFDPVTFAPTYHLTIGVPGGSNALETAARLGLDIDIVAQARSMLSGGAREVEALIAGLNKERDHARIAREQAEEEKLHVERLKREMETSLKELQTKQKNIIQEARDKVVTEAAELQREIRETAAEMRKQKSKDSVERTRKVLA